jgi:hypothetical protein
MLGCNRLHSLLDCYYWPAVSRLVRFGGNLDWTRSGAGWCFGCSLLHHWRMASLNETHQRRFPWGGNNCRLQCASLHNSHEHCGHTAPRFCSSETAPTSQIGCITHHADVAVMFVLGLELVRFPPRLRNVQFASTVQAVHSARPAHGLLLHPMPVAAVAPLSQLPDGTVPAARWQLCSATTAATICTSMGGCPSARVSSLTCGRSSSGRGSCGPETRRCNKFLTPEESAQAERAEA